jgi:hypothetical protein
MERLHRALVTGALLLAGGTGCSTFGKGTDAGTLPDMARAQKPDVMKPGVLPPPQEVLRAAAPKGGGLVPAGGAQPVQIQPVAYTNAPPAAAPVPVPAPAKPSALARTIGLSKPTMPASEMQVAWRKQIAHLPDPTKNGALGAGVVGQMFLFGGPRMEFVEANGVLTIDLVDDTPRSAGTPPVDAKRWHFPKEVLRKMKTGDETFGKSYVLFLPWPEYRSDVTRVRVAARYDQDDGHTIYAAPTTVTFDHSTTFGAPVWNGGSTTTTTPPDIRPGTTVGVLPTAEPAPLNPIALPGPSVPVAVPASGGTSVPVGSVPGAFGAPVLPPQPAVPAPNLSPVGALAPPSAPGLGPVEPPPPPFAGK